MKTFKRLFFAKKKRKLTALSKQVLLLLLISHIISNGIHAQNTSVAMQNRGLNNYRYLDSNAAIEEKLVALAMQGPEVRGAEHQNKINEYTLKAARTQWINTLALSANYNDQSFKQAPGGAYVYPKYFFGFTLPLGTLLSKTQVKAAQEQIEISKANEEQLQRNIRAEVIGKYRQYLAYNEMIRNQSEFVNDIQVTASQSEEKFKNNLISLESYTAAQKSKNDEIAKLINLQVQRDLLKLDLEKMIGTNLETVLR